MKIVFDISVYVDEDTRMKKNIEGLAWYKDAYNHGRGKLSAEANRLLKAGYLRLKWLSARDWVLTITAKGVEALK